MRKDLTEIVVILDRSGSMQSCRSDMEGGLNNFIEEQKKAVGEARFTLVQFDNTSEVVVDNLNIQNVGPQKLVPRGGTALLDAIGKTINEVGIRLAKMKEEDRPGLVIFMIITDGEENSSREFNGLQIKEMIERQTKEYSWQFLYLGANQDAFAIGSSIGVKTSANYDVKFSKNLYSASSNNVGRMRMSRSLDESVSSEYTKDELTSMSEDKVIS